MVTDAARAVLGVGPAAQHPSRRGSSPGNTNQPASSLGSSCLRHRLVPPGYLSYDVPGPFGLGRL